jgi:tetratricopeptide (TPR) repeat protein
VRLRPGDLFVGRFEVQGDQEEILRARWLARRAGYLPYESRVDIRDLCLRGVDRTTGRPVLIEPRGGARTWADDFAREAAARRVADLASPLTAPVLHVGPGVVYAEPAPGLPRGTFSSAEAAELTLQACVLAYELRAAGSGTGAFDPHNLRVIEDGGQHRIHWIAPGARDLAHFALQGRYQALRPRLDALWRADPGRITAWYFLDFFVALQPSGALDFASPEIAALLRMHHDPEAPLPEHPAALAGLLLPIAPPSSELTARVKALQKLQEVKGRGLDWDLVVADGEAELAGASERDRDYLRLPLAAAYHQRASRAWAAGELADALRDVERALALDKPFLPYHTTRAILLDGLGRGAEAKAELDEAIPQTPPEPEVVTWRRHSDAPSPAERARAHAARGRIALREGAFAEAERHLATAMDLAPTALYAHTLGAARYALGDIVGAAQAEQASIDLDPNEPRYRWALIGSLRKLGRHDEAKAHADEILNRWPDDTAHRDKFTKLFGPRRHNPSD